MIGRFICEQPPAEFPAALAEAVDAHRSSEDTIFEAPEFSQWFIDATQHVVVRTAKRLSTFRAQICETVDNIINGGHHEKVCKLSSLVSIPQHALKVIGAVPN